MSSQNAQSMKPATAAKKLDVYLPATPAEFQEGTITRDELVALQADPPQWLQDLRKSGPHPKNLVAARLGISIAGLQRSGVGEALTTEQITELTTTPPQWLIDERGTLAAARADEQRAAEARAASNRPRRQ